MGRREDTDIDGLVHDLVERAMRDWTRRVLFGDDRAAQDVQTTVIDSLSERDARDLFAQALTDPTGAGDAFAALTIKAMRAQCVKEVEEQLVLNQRATDDDLVDLRVATAFERQQLVAERAQ